MDDKQKITSQIIKKSFFPVIIFITLIGTYIFYKFNIQYKISPETQVNIGRYIKTFFILCTAFLTQRIIGAVLLWFKENIAVKTPSRLDDELIPLLRRVAKVVIWIIALLIILPLYGININALIAALGVTSLAIALAAQDTIANIIAGFLIMIDRPFRIGDKIKLPSGELVKVLDIGVRRSRFLAEDNAIIILPNLELSKSKIINYTYEKEPEDAS